MAAKKENDTKKKGPHKGKKVFKLVAAAFSPVVEIRRFTSGGALTDPDMLPAQFSAAGRVVNLVTATVGSTTTFGIVVGSIFSADATPIGAANPPWFSPVQSASVASDGSWSLSFDLRDAATGMSPGTGFHLTLRVVYLAEPPATQDELALALMDLVTTRLT